VTDAATSVAKAITDMNFDDDDTPVAVPNPIADHEALLIQLGELRKSHELWRPIVETAKIVVGIWHGGGGGTPSFEHAVEMLSNMLNLATAAEQADDR
jgi:hypothetical protein